MSDPRPIGVFDSGVGGLTVLREILRRLPFESTVYLGDNANDLPIGTWHQGQAARNALVDQNKAGFGTRFVAFPNPVYGNWEDALASGYSGMTPEQRNAARKAALSTWLAKP